MYYSYSKNLVAQLISNVCIIHAHVYVQSEPQRRSVRLNSGAGRWYSLFQKWISKSRLGGEWISEFESCTCLREPLAWVIIIIMWYRAKLHSLLCGPTSFVVVFCSTSAKIREEKDQKKFILFPSVFLPFSPLSPRPTELALLLARSHIRYERGAPTAVVAVRRPKRLWPSFHEIYYYDTYSLATFVTWIC